VLACFELACGVTSWFGGNSDDPLAGHAVIAVSAFETTADPSQARVLVRWNAPRAPQATPQPYSSYVIGYEVYRSTSPSFPTTADNMITVMLGGTQTAFIDTNTSSGAMTTITLTTAEDGLVTETVEEEAWDGTALPSREFATDTATYIIVPSPLQSGDTYYYAIRAITKKLPPSPFPPQDTSGGTGGGGTTTSDQDLTGRLVVGSTLSYAGPATAVQRPELVSPPDYPEPGSQDVSLDTVQFQWMTVPGANSYVIEVSTDREFPRDQILQSSVIQINDTTGGLQVARPFEGGGFATSFQGYDGPICWRIGARREADALEPVDVTTNKTIGWVFSEPFAFEAETAPPLPPG
jgi:hypothetical protein